MADDQLLDETNLSTDSPTSTKEEIRQWMLVNRCLRKHGFETLRVLPSQEIVAKSGRYVCLDLQSSESLRSALGFLLDDAERHDQAKSQLRELTQETVDAKRKAKDIQVMLECSRSRVQELEEECSRSSSQFAEEGERLRNTKSVASNRCRQLEAQVREQEKEIERLKREMLSLAVEEERRSKRSSQVFSDFKKRPARSQSSTDQTLLDVIDSYENQIHQLQEQLKLSSQGDDEVSVSSQGHRQGHYKDIIQSFEKQLRIKDRKLKALEAERNSAQFESGSRAEMTDYRVLAQKVKQMERILRLHNISIPGEKPSKDPYTNRKKFSVRLEDLDYLPLEESHRYLRSLCQILQTDNLDCLADLVQEMKEDGLNGDRFRQYCKELADIVQSVDETNGRLKSRNYERDSATLLCDANMRHFLEVADNWRKDISGLDTLQSSLNDLLDKCVPWLRARMEGEHSVSDMVETLDRVVHACKDQRTQVGMEGVSRPVLEEMVCHFQTLFDVKNVSGVYPRMDQIYKSLGEARNTQNSLKNILGLAEESNSSVLVDVVGELCRSYNSSTSKQLKTLLQTDDLSGVIRRLEEYNEFFPAFRFIMAKLLDILGIDKMDEVLPAVRALKLLAR